MHGRRHQTTSFREPQRHVVGNLQRKAKDLLFSFYTFFGGSRKLCKPCDGYFLLDIFNLMESFSTVPFPTSCIMHVKDGWWVGKIIQMGKGNRKYILNYFPFKLKEALQIMLDCRIWLIWGKKKLNGWGKQLHYSQCLVLMYYL